MHEPTPEPADAITAFWAPDEVYGFLPHGVPTSLSDLATAAEPAVRELALLSARLGATTDDEVAARVVGLANAEWPSPETATPELCEGIVRSCTMLAARLIHRSPFAGRGELPPGVARPLWNFSQRLQRAPSLTYASYVLGNFSSPVKARSAARDLQIAQTPSCTDDEAWFVAVHLAIESAGGEVVGAARRIDQGLRSQDEALLVNGLRSVESFLTFARETLPCIRDRLDPLVFRDVIRPLLYGHTRVVFRGVDAEPSVTYVGETGAQSGVIRAADALLGPMHSEGMRASMDHFLSYAPGPHREYLHAAAGLGRELAGRRNPNVQAARRAALRELAEFRRLHRTIVLEYLVGDGAPPRVERGTGGTQFETWLQTLIDDAATAAEEA